MCVCERERERKRRRDTTAHALTKTPTYHAHTHTRNSTPAQEMICSQHHLHLETHCWDVMVDTDEKKWLWFSVLPQRPVSFLEHKPQEKGEAMQPTANLLELDLRQLPLLELRPRHPVLWRLVGWEVVDCPILPCTPAPFPSPSLCLSPLMVLRLLVQIHPQKECPALLVKSPTTTPPTKHKWRMGWPTGHGRRWNSTFR